MDGNLCEASSDSFVHLGFARLGRLTALDIGRRLLEDYPESESKPVYGAGDRAHIGVGVRAGWVARRNPTHRGQIPGDGHGIENDRNPGPQSEVPRQHVRSSAVTVTKMPCYETVICFYFEFVGWRLM